MRVVPFSVFVVVGLGSIFLLGCGSREAASGGTDSSSSATDASSDNDPFVLGNMVEMEEADVPSLEELDAQVTWEEMPVLDSLELLRQHQKSETVLATSEEALELRNDSPEANAKITSALGRLPESDEEVDWDAEISRHVRGDVKSTNPILISSSTEFDLLGMTSAGLFSFNWKFDAYAAAETVKMWYSSKDRKYDKVVLRDDWTWSDGTPVTAYDVEFSFKVILSDKVPAAAVRSGTDELQYVKAYDDRTVVFFHKEALATNHWNVNFPILPKHIYEQSIHQDPKLTDSAEHVKYENAPICNGAFTIVKRTPGVEIVLQRREGWYKHKDQTIRDKPFFKTVRFRIIEDGSVALLALKKGQVDELQLTPAQWMTQTSEEDFYKNNTKAYGLEWVSFSFFWNNKVIFFEDPRVRRAMSYAFDHEEMLQELRFGMDEPSTGIFHPTSRWSTKPAPTPYRQDLDKAEALLEEAGWIDHDGDGYLDKEFQGRYVRFDFSLLVSNQQWRIDICNLLRENLDRLGILCRIQPLEPVVLQEMMRMNQFQCAFSGWGTGTDPDTSENLWTTKAIGKGRNYCQYSNSRVDALFEKGKRAFELKEREAIYQEIQQILWDDQPYTWLFYRNSMFGFNRRLRGFKFSPRGPYNYGPGFFSIWVPKTKKE